MVCGKILYKAIFCDFTIKCFNKKKKRTQVYLMFYFKRKPFKRKLNKNPEYFEIKRMEILCFYVRLFAGTGKNKFLI